MRNPCRRTTFRVCETACKFWLLRHKRSLEGPWFDPYPLKNEIWGGGVVLKFHFKIPFLQSCFLNDQYSSSFHVIGKQMKIKYLRLAIRLKQHMCRDDIPPKIALPSSYLRLAPPELSASIFKPVPKAGQEMLLWNSMRAIGSLPQGYQTKKVEFDVCC